MSESLKFVVQFIDRYRFLYVERESELVDVMTRNLDYAQNAIKELFAVDIDILFFNVFVCPSRGVFDRFVESITNTPTDKGRIGQTQGHDMYFLSPNAYRREAPFYATDRPPFYDDVELRHNMVHEMVHVWEELNSPRVAMDTRPGWFSEGLAMYVSESNQEQEFGRRLLADYRKGIMPGPDDMAGERNYTWGCVLFEYIMNRFGPKRILHIIEKTCERDVISLLGDRSAIVEGYVRYLPERIEQIASTMK